MDRHGLSLAHEQFLAAQAFGESGEFEKARTALQRFVELLLQGISRQPAGADTVSTLCEGFDWRLALPKLKTGLSDEADWRFRLRLTLLFTELLIQGFEQRLNS